MMVWIYNGRCVDMSVPFCCSYPTKAVGEGCYGEMTHDRPSMVWKMSSFKENDQFGMLNFVGVTVALGNGMTAIVEILE